MSNTEAAGPGPSRNLGALLARTDVVIAAALALAAALAWIWLIRMDAGVMAAMSQQKPFSAEYLVTGFAMWSVMMLAMMLPAAAPMILLYARVSRGRSATGASHTPLFVVTYLLVWTSFSGVAVILQAVLVHLGAMSTMSLALDARQAASGLLFGSAIYELTTAKRACLSKCQSPLLFIVRRWHPGTWGAIRLGLLHGLYCLGCCWAVMLLLFVGGVMNLAWVAALGIIVVVQKLARPSWRAERYLAAALVVGGAALLIT